MVNIRKRIVLMMTFALTIMIVIAAKLLISPKMANENLILEDSKLKETIKRANSNDCSAIDSLIWHYSSIGDKKNEQIWEGAWKRSGCKYGVKY